MWSAGILLPHSYLERESSHTVTQIGQSNPHHTLVTPQPDAIAVTLAWASMSDTGHRRAINEDSALAAPAIFAVTDGMGGHSAGDFASTAVVTRLAEYADNNFIRPDVIDQALNNAVGDISSGAGDSELGTGTTATGAALTLIEGQPHWIVFNIGDSRVYQLLNGALEQVTVDHSVVQELVDAGLITRDEADVHPQSNVITRAVGFNDPPVPDYRVIPVTAGMRLLICSDGLTKELTDQGIHHFLISHASPSEAATELLNMALENGGRDNVTVVVVDVLSLVKTGDDALTVS
jgi:serine/threonine protein phosphatase PrpC